MDIQKMLNDSVPVRKKGPGDIGPKIEENCVFLRTTPSGTDTIYIPNKVLRENNVSRNYFNATFCFGKEGSDHTILFVDQNELEYLIQNTMLVEDNFYTLQFDGGAKFSGNLVRKNLNLKDGIYYAEIENVDAGGYSGNHLGIEINDLQRFADELTWVHDSDLDLT